MGDLSEHFSRSEFRCHCGCGFDTVDAELIRVLELLRSGFGGCAVTINSGCRCKKQNRAVGGSDGSMHIGGKAADIVVAGIGSEHVADYLEGRYAGAYGIGRYPTWTHIDVRSGPKARWRDGS